MKSRFKFLTVLIVFAVAMSAGADETFPTLQVNRITYKNVTITAVTATDIYFSYDGGMGNAKLRDLSPELQQHFHYDATAAAAQEQQQAQANAQYLASRAPQWGTDLPAALDQARSENRYVLMDFTGSDWCPWCIKLEQDVFSTPQFAGWANSKLLLVRVDFPHNIPQNEELRQANGGLATRFNVDGYPTCILVDSTGKELHRETGYVPGGPQAFIGRFDGFIPTTLAPSPVASTSTQAAPPGAAPAQPATQIASLLAAAPKLGQNWYWIAPISAGLMILLIGRAFSRKST